MNAVIKQLLVTVMGGVTVAILVPLVTGCSSPGGCRTCRKESPGPPPAPTLPAANPMAGPVSPASPSGTPGGSAIAAAPYGGQKTCPVTGEELGSMGQPIPVTLKGQTVYVCCRGCVAKAQADPDKALAAVAAERAR
jgi:hypothetical protein